MKLEDGVKEYPGSVWCSGGGPGGSEMNHLGECVDKYNNGIKPCFGLWKLRDKVHGDLFPGLLWNWQWLEKSCRNLLTRFDPLTRVTGFDILTHFIVHPRPIKRSEERRVGNECSK